MPALSHGARVSAPGGSNMPPSRASRSWSGLRRKMLIRRVYSAISRLLDGVLDRQHEHLHDHAQTEAEHEHVERSVEDRRVQGQLREEPHPDRHHRRADNRERLIPSELADQAAAAPND